MSTVNLAATALYSTGWTKVGALGNVDTINSDDDATSYFRCPGDTNTQLYFTFESLPAGVISVNTVTFFAKCDRLGTQAECGQVSFWHVSSAPTEYKFPASSFYVAGWTWYNTGSITTGVGAGGWTIAEVDSTKFGMYGDGGGSRNDRYNYCTAMYAQADVLLSGSFVIAYALPLLGVLGGGVTALGSMLRQLVPRVGYTRPELEAIREDIRAAQRGYCFLDR